MTALPPPMPPALRVERAGAWNLKVGRNTDVVVDEVSRLLTENRLDWLVVVEAQGYVAALRKALAPLGYVLLTDWTDPSARDSAVIAKARLFLGEEAHLHRLGGVEWERKPGRPGLHWARSAVAVEIFGLKVLATHLPPGPFGPRFPLRRLAYAVALRRVRRIVRRWQKAGKPFVAPGDWNKRKTEPGSWLVPSPRWLAETTGAEITGDGIDFVVSDGVTVRNYRRLDAGNSDHPAVLFEVVR